MFIKVAVSALVDAFVAGKLKDFLPAQRHGVRVLNSREWLELWSRMRGV